MFRNPHLLYIASIFFTLFCILSAFWFPSRSQDNVASDETASIIGDKDLDLDVIPSPPTFEPQLLFGLDVPLDYIPPHSLTVIFPVTPRNLFKMKNLLRPFINPPGQVRELILVCPYSSAADIRRELQALFASLEPSEHLDVSLQPWQTQMGAYAAVLECASHLATDWVLIMDEKGLQGIPELKRQDFLRPPNFELPLGVDGLSSERYAVFSSQWGTFQPARYVRPPFVMPSSLLLGFDIKAKDENVWERFGSHVSSLRPRTVGGLIKSFPESDLSGSGTRKVNEVLSVEDNVPLAWQTPLPDDLNYSTFLTNSSPASRMATGANFTFFLPTMGDLHNVSSLLCGLSSNETIPDTRILVYEDRHPAPNQVGWRSAALRTDKCTIEYDILTSPKPGFPTSDYALLRNWVEKRAMPAHIVFALQEASDLTSFLVQQGRNSVFLGVTIIRVPRADLQDTEWMSSLSLQEWKNWHKPRIDLSIITKDRPASLRRLLDSLLNARYFGDQLNLRVNIEQDCNEETLKMAESLEWAHGSVFVHHRVIHGGLLPAVVEAWYPKSNDSYGLLLEDDVELSPLFYAWIKMAVLRYRYGSASNLAPHVFGVSLYQQKHLELPLSGRQAFNPRKLFSQAGFRYPRIPYLSQVPCSWGAVYFPEHWREFHDYLALRLTESILTIEDEVVPDVRSNHWSKSWKKFFIELVYLRGYVMLYPNFDSFVSLSTNHLEVGSHVKVRSPEKQDLFLLPLMQVSKPKEICGLLDLPNGTLPPLDNLPILNLTGFITSLPDLVQQGKSRRSELLKCDYPARLYDVASLMCINDPLS